MFTRYFFSNRKIAILSILTGLFIALLMGSIQFFWSYQKRQAKFDTLISDLSVYMEGYFGELKTAIDVLQPLTLSNCHDVSGELTSRAAFSINVRAFCWSGTAMRFAHPQPGLCRSPCRNSFLT